MEQTIQPKDILGSAINDHYRKASRARLYIHNTYGEKEEMPIELYFRTPDVMPGIELLAIQECKGKVLEIGAGAGSHALLLQDLGYDITALEISVLACETITSRGIKKVLQKDFFRFKTKHRYDTLLLLMNGIGLCQTLDGFKTFISSAYEILKPGGQILFDSSDVAYLYKSMPVNNTYYGELRYRYEYKKRFGDWFTWLYMDKKTLIQIVDNKKWHTDILYETEDDQFLVRMIKKN